MFYKQGPLLLLALFITVGLVSRVNDMIVLRSKHFYELHIMDMSSHINYLFFCLFVCFKVFNVGNDFFFVFTDILDYAV